ncbi:hypothetical protein K505DRAFT_362585 [Melanomma pulvis-pyrius CBS 109.77]|uniref:F-box domain-containing protein n=1 Tax=Melanomma pulvis-pyrius CBS 109.77 TaxID=1314802 RepID=A0A6A6X9N9_9PLEO|nr:hypothetical protein K505DRAFT_362585 [Melanomma pulvis-pyrius CBS 109.77]
MPTTIATLPNDLLSSIASHLSPSTCIRNLRLVSRRFNAVSSPYLISSTLVSFTSQSLLDLEELASRPVFAKGVEKVNADVSYVDEVLASGMGNFVRNAESEEDNDDIGDLGETNAANEELESLVGGNDEKYKVKSSYDYVSEAYGVPIEWTVVYSPGFEKDKASEKQSLILNTYEGHVKLFEDQEIAVPNEEGLKRIVKTL